MTDNVKTWDAELQQRSAKASRLFADFVKIIAELRHPERGCPWDLEQTHQTLRKYMLEEAYEASEAMEIDEPQAMVEELGDVLLQVVLNSQLLSDDKRGDICQVIEGISAKMLRRHPHVFASDDGQSNLTPQEVRQQWERIKQAEKPAGSANAQEGLFAEAEKTRHPATYQALLTGKIAHKLGFDWQQPMEVLQQLESEIQELKQEMQSSTIDRQRLIDEMGDVYFTLAQLSRHLKLDPELAAQTGNIKFLRRFRCLENLAQQEGVDLINSPISEWERLWQEAKKKREQKT
ncbi:MAG: nucleoside triphosphate pyrophosphohydrolase [Oligoflexus sp.]